MESKIPILTKKHSNSEFRILKIWFLNSNNPDLYSELCKLQYFNHSLNKRIAFWILRCENQEFVLLNSGFWNQNFVNWYATFRLWRLRFRIQNSESRNPKNISWKLCSWILNSENMTSEFWILIIRIRILNSEFWKMWILKSAHYSLRSYILDSEIRILKIQILNSEFWILKIEVRIQQITMRIP